MCIQWGIVLAYWELSSNVITATLKLDCHVLMWTCISWLLFRMYSSLRIDEIRFRSRSAWHIPMRSRSEIYGAYILAIYAVTVFISALYVRHLRDVTHVCSLVCYKDISDTSCDDKIYEQFCSTWKICGVRFLRLTSFRRKQRNWGSYQVEW